MVEMDVQFRRNPTDKLFDFPNGFAAAASFPKDNDVIHICLRIIPQNEAEEGGFSGAVGSKEGPAFTSLNGPVDAAQNGCRSIADSHVLQANKFLARRVGILFAVFERPRFADGNALRFFENFPD